MCETTEDATEHAGRSRFSKAVLPAFAVLFFVCVLGLFWIIKTVQTGAAKEGPVNPDQFKTLIIYPIDSAWGAHVVEVLSESEDEVRARIRETKVRESRKELFTYQCRGYKVNPETTARMFDHVSFETPRLITPFWQGAYFATARLDNGSEVRLCISIIGSVEFGYDFAILGQEGFYRTEGESSKVFVQVMDEAVRRWGTESD